MIINGLLKNLRQLRSPLQFVLGMDAVVVVVEVFVAFVVTVLVCNWVEEVVVEVWVEGVVREDVETGEEQLDTSFYSAAFRGQKWGIWIKFMKISTSIQVTQLINKYIYIYISYTLDITYR